ncbi:hypothetical protein AMS68_003003 [Peltaster fructicola]|uniref:Uncharacterized protein n=1 Tax=Peltaster fructicola TaxID=286661 RepID=A0A6H0XS21_9PEZI|nr:hypothetical protein AMS68_003003 [Peltaster fructicola]
MSQSKKDIIEERRQNLPLPDDPPGEPIFNTADASAVNVGSGKIESNEPEPGREAHDNLKGPPNDAVSRSAKDHAGLSKTTNEDAPAQ